MSRRRGRRRRTAIDAQATPPPSRSYPPWVLLEPYADVDTTGSYSTADPNTLVVARTTSGHPIGVSLSLAVPPAESRVCVQFPRDTNNPPERGNQIIAAHGDSVLLQVARENEYKADYFVYNAGTTAAGNSPQRPPSLSLLPPCHLKIQVVSTGLLHRGEDELVVACLKIQLPNDKDKEHVAEMLWLRNGKWRVTRWPQIAGIEKEKLVGYCSSSGVIPVGEDTLRWVFIRSGLMFSNMFDNRRVLRYVPLPEDPYYCSANTYMSRNVCVTSGGGTVRFVNTFARCCCGGDGASQCKHSKHCYVIKTWTLRMDSMMWVVDGMMDCTELWALDA